MPSHREFNQVGKFPVPIALAFQRELDIEQDKSDTCFKENRADGCNRVD